MSFSSHLPHIDGEAARSLVVGSIISYGRSQTFLSGSNLASTPVDDNVFGTTDEEDYIDPYEAEDDESDWEGDRARLIRAAADHDEEFVVGTTGWDEDQVDAPTPTALGPPTTSLGGPSRPRAFTRPIPGSSRASRTRFTSTPTVPSSSVRASRGRGVRPIGNVPHISPPTIDARPSSAPVVPRFMPSSPPITQIDERTPLISISGASSTYSGESGSTPTSEATVTGLTIPSHAAERRLSISQPDALRKPSMRRRSSARPRPVLPPGKSTYGQTVRCRSPNRYLISTYVILTSPTVAF